MVNKYILSLFFIFTAGTSFSQADSVRLKEIVVSAYLEDRPVLRLPASAAVIDSSHLQKQAGQSLAPALNTVPGVRMEERSPGSYRLSIRGSLIRSPFGIRNTKLYLDEFPLTNAGGDAYLNLIDPDAIHRIEILKGPDGSLFGANSGGVVRIEPRGLQNNRSLVSIGIGGGSFGLFRQNVEVQQAIDKNTLNIYESWQRSDGYRQHSAMDRKYFQLADRYLYSQKAQLRFLFLYSDLNYQTPGALTLAQYRQDPQSARPATSVVPGAKEQKAGVRNHSFYGGILHDIKFTDRIRHVIAVFSTHTLFENPFITNYEVRNENNTGVRTWLEFKNKNTSGIQLRFNVGGEAQVMQSRISNYGNNQGTKDTVQAIDDVRTTQAFAFTRLTADLYNKWIIEASLSCNYNRFLFTRQKPVESALTERNFEAQLMPRLALSYLVSQTFSVRAVVSRGYSPPTLQEIRSSDNTINTSIEPESGWNYEIGYRLRTKAQRVWWDVSAFYYELSNAIVKRINTVGQDYFVNAGGTFQPGIESQLILQLIRANKDRFIRGLQLSNAYTYQAYTFNNYYSGASNFSGNNLTGVPKHISVTGLTVNFPAGFYLFSQYYYTSQIPLNDANTEYAAEYHLVQLKAGWHYSGQKRFEMELSTGVDNLLQRQYSLGNDLNALGNRYYNAAPGINYFGKLNLWF